MAPDEDLEAADDLAVLDLEDTDLGVRTEDRYAAIPPGPRLVRRREHPDRDRGPAVVLLVALAVLFAVAAWLDGISSDESDDDASDNAVPPVLDEPTGTVLLTVGNDGASLVDVDEGGVDQSLSLEGLARDALLVDRTLIVRGLADDITAIPLDGTSRRGLPRAEALLPSAAPDRVWLVAPSVDSSHAIEVTAADGAVTGEIDIAGRVLGATNGGLVVADPAGTLLLVTGSTPAVVLSPDLAFVATAPNAIASRTRECNAEACELVITQIPIGEAQRIDLSLGPGGHDAALFSPDARHLAVVRSDGIESFGVVVDLEAGTGAPFRSRALARDANRPLAWSSEGDWLFIATERSGLDAVDIDGNVFRVDIELPETEALLLAAES